MAASMVGGWQRWLLAVVIVGGLLCVTAPRALANGSGYLSAYADNSCAVKTDGHPACWGYNAYGENNVPAGVGTVKTISTGDSFACVIKSDDTPSCWGYHDDGETTVPDGTGTVTGIATGTSHACAIKAADSTPVCWGYNRSGETVPPVGITVKAIAAGDDLSCAIKTDNTVVCWGDNSYGQLNVPGGLGTVKAITTGNAYVCAIKTDNTLACWGLNTSGQASVPGGLGTVKAVSGGGGHTCAIKTDGTPVCWGRNNDGQTTLPSGIGAVTAIAAGGNHTCAVQTAGTTLCWGDNTWGQTAVPGTVGTVGPLPPSTSGRPTISGGMGVGGTLTADPGTWSGSPTYSYIWQRCAASGAGTCEPIDGAPDSDMYTLTGDDAGHRIRVAVKATNDAGSDKVPSVMTGVVGRPAVIDRPTISGTLEPDQTLTADHGNWSGSPTDYSYTWQRCTTANPSVCTTVSGPSTDADYQTTADDLGNRLRVLVTATNTAGSSNSLSLMSGEIGSKPTTSDRPTITGNATEGQLLTADHGTWTGNPTYTYTWQHCTTTCTTVTTGPDASYTPDSDDVGKRIRVLVTATNVVGSAKAVSLVTRPITSPT